MKTIAELLAAQCRPLTEGAYTEDRIRTQLAALPGWTFDGRSLVRTYRFADYYRTIAFVNALAHLAHAEDHHPELRIGYDRCEVRFDTHSVGGISDNDFICAAKSDAIHAHRFVTPAA